MKSKIFVIILIFLIMGTVPAVTILGNKKEISSEKTNIPTENQLSENQLSSVTNSETEPPPLSQDDTVKGMIFAVYNENFNEETIKALAVLFQSNLKANKDSIDINNKDIYISEKEFKSKYNSPKEIINQINSSLSAVENIYIYDENEIAYIPYSQCSCGHTVTDEKYPSLIEIASPWDTLSENYSSENKCIGVSIDGVIFLTENNNDYLTALKWYLPKYTIEG